MVAGAEELPSGAAASDRGGMSGGPAAAMSTSGLAAAVAAFGDSHVSEVSSGDGGGCARGVVGFAADCDGIDVERSVSGSE